MPSSTNASDVRRRRTQRRVVVAAVAIAVTAVIAFFGYRWFFTVCCVQPVPRSSELGPRPRDFAMVVQGGNGHVAPASHSDFEIRIDSGGRGTIRYSPGYGQSDSLDVLATFPVSDSAMDALHALSRALWHAPGPVSRRDIPDGGHPTRITMVANGRRTVIAPWQPVTWRPLVDSVERAARAVVPDSVWSRCREAQARYVPLAPVIGPHS